MTDYKLEIPLDNNEIIMYLKTSIPQHFRLLKKIFDDQQILFNNLHQDDEYLENDKGEFELIQLPKLGVDANKLLYLKLKDNFLELKPTSDFNATSDTMNFTKDVMILDQEFMRGEYAKQETTCIVLFRYLLINGERKLFYSGHVWGFSSDENPFFYAIYAMKASIANTINRENLHIATKLIYNGVIPFMKEEGRTKLIVVWPLPPMIKILRKLTFTEFDTIEMTPERKFYENVAGGTHYFTYDVEQILEN